MLNKQTHLFHLSTKINSVMNLFKYIIVHMLLLFYVFHNIGNVTNLSSYFFKFCWNDIKMVIIIKHILVEKLTFIILLKYLVSISKFEKKNQSYAYDTYMAILYWSLNNFTFQALFGSFGCNYVKFRRLSFHASAGPIQTWNKEILVLWIEGKQTNIGTHAQVNQRKPIHFELLLNISFLAGITRLLENPLIEN